MNVNLCSTILLILLTCGSNAAQLKDRVNEARSDVTAAALSYKDSLKKLLDLQETDLASAKEALERQRSQYEQAQISKREVESAERSVDEAEKRIIETKAQIEETDKLIEEVSKVTPQAAPTKKTSPPTRQSKKSLCKDCRVI